MTNKQFWKKTHAPSALKADRLDFLDYHHVENRLDLEKAGEQLSTVTGGDPLRDTYLLLHKRTPELQDPPPTEAENVHNALSIIKNLPNFPALRAPESETAAALMARSIINKTLQAMPPEARQNMRASVEHQRVAKQKRTNAERYLEQVKLFQEIHQKTGKRKFKRWANLAEQKAKTFISEAEKHEKSARENSEAAKNATEKVKAGITARLNNSVNDINKTTKDSIAFMKSFTEAAGGDPTNIDEYTLKTVMKLLQELPNISGFAEMIGWAKRSARAEYHKSIARAGKPIRFIRDRLIIQDMASVELTRMTTDNDNPQFVQWLEDMSNDNILTVERETEEKMGFGTMIVLVDESGSMSENLHHAKAIEWALLDIARNDERKFYGIGFSGKGQLNIWQSQNDKPDPKALADHILHNFNSGTYPYLALEKALQLIKRGEDADIVILTDGEFSAPPNSFMAQLQNVKNDTPMKIHFVGIGVHKPPTFADTRVLASTLYDKNTVSTIAGNIFN